MRTKMPVCAAFVDDLREAFGVEEINSVIKRGLRSDCEPKHRVYFSEAGHVLGQSLPESGRVFSAAQLVIRDQVPAVSGKRGRA